MCFYYLKLVGYRGKALADFDSNFIAGFHQLFNIMAETVYVVGEFSGDFQFWNVLKGGIS